MKQFISRVRQHSPQIPLASLKTKIFLAKVMVNKSNIKITLDKSFKKKKRREEKRKNNHCERRTSLISNREEAK